MPILRASNYQEATIRPIVPKSNKILFVLMTTKFLFRTKVNETGISNFFTELVLIHPGNFARWTL